MAKQRTAITLTPLLGGGMAIATLRQSYKQRSPSLCGNRYATVLLWVRWECGFGRGRGWLLVKCTARSSSCKTLEKLNGYGLRSFMLAFNLIVGRSRNGGDAGETTGKSVVEEAHQEKRVVNRLILWIWCQRLVSSCRFRNRGCAFRQNKISCVSSLIKSATFI